MNYSDELRAIADALETDWKEDTDRADELIARIESVAHDLAVDVALVVSKRLDDESTPVP